MSQSFPGRLYEQATKSDREIINLKNPFRLSSPVGISSSNLRRDVAKVETLMSQTGYLDLDKTDGPTGYYGERLKQSVQNFQKDKGLKKDGLINPRGETMQTLKKQKSLEQQLRDKGIQNTDEISKLGAAEMRSLLEMLDNTDSLNSVEKVFTWTQGKLDKHFGRKSNVITDIMPADGRN